MSRKSCGYAGLLGEALSISAPGHVLSLMHGSDVSVNRAASQMWLEPLVSGLLLMNTLALIFAACTTS